MRGPRNGTVGREVFVPSAASCIGCVLDSYTTQCETCVAGRAVSPPHGAECAARICTAPLRNGLTAVTAPTLTPPTADLTPDPAEIGHGTSFSRIKTAAQALVRTGGVLARSLQGGSRTTASNLFDLPVQRACQPFVYFLG